MENAQPLNTVGGEDMLPVGLAMIVGATKTGNHF